MLNNISWASYTYALIIILVIYYAAVLVLYYRKDLYDYSLKISHGSIPPAGDPLSVEEQIDGLVAHLSLDTAMGQVVAVLLLSIHALVRNAALENFTKPILLQALQERLSDLPGSPDKSLQDSINNFIVIACENNGSVHLRLDEVSALWD